MKRVAFIILLSLTLTGCGREFQSLAPSPSFISITRYHPDFSRLESEMITGQDMEELYKGLKKSGQHIVPKDARYNCGAATEEKSWYYDVVIHYENSNRLFVIKKEGCTFIQDAKDNLLLEDYGLPDMDSFF